jgi:biopolymer transport protein ExbD
MRKRRRISADGESFPLSTMIDVVFLLLIYFIVTQKPIVEETLLNTDLPTASREHQEFTNMPITIDVYKEKGDFYRVMGFPWRGARLFEYLKDIGKNDPEQTILINCGAKAEHQKLIKLLDACADARLQNLNIINDESRPLK